MLVMPILLVFPFQLSFVESSHTIQPLEFNLTVSLISVNFNMRISQGRQG